MQPTNIEVNEQFIPLEELGITSISPNSRFHRNLARRMRRVQAEIEAGPPKQLRSIEAQRDWYRIKETQALSLENGVIPEKEFPKGFDFSNYGHAIDNAKQVFEITYQGSFGDDFARRLEYEVDAGRDEHPVILDAIYNVQTNANFPKVFQIQTLRGVGVIVEEVKEGGEVQFATVGNDKHTITIARYAAGLSYSFDIFEHNQTWDLAPIEREFGKAMNALHNHAHLNPILTHSYTSDNQTAASSVGSTLYEKYANTIDAAVSAAMNDDTNPRTGPFVIICNVANMTTIERAMGRVPQEGFNLRPSNLDNIQRIIGYAGWSGGKIGRRTVSYPGVDANKAYLVDLSHRAFDLQSKIKNPMRRQQQPGDLKRFIMAEVVFDTQFGLYAAPARCVQEITLPTS